MPGKKILTTLPSTNKQRILRFFQPKNKKFVFMIMKIDIKDFRNNIFLDKQDISTGKTFYQNKFHS